MAYGITRADVNYVRLGWTVKAAVGVVDDFLGRRRELLAYVVPSHSFPHVELQPSQSGKAINEVKECAHHAAFTIEMGLSQHLTFGGEIFDVIPDTIRGETTVFEDAVGVEDALF